MRVQATVDLSSRQPFCTVLQYLADEQLKSFSSVKQPSVLCLLTRALDCLSGSKLYVCTHVCGVALTKYSTGHCILGPVASMSRTVLGIHDEAGPVLIRTSKGADKPSSQDMAVLGSLVTYAEGIGVQFSSVATDDITIGFRRYSAGIVVN